MSAKILVVEDEPDAVELLTYHLQQNGFEALTAGTGIEALHKARQFLPDLIVLDLQLPDIDGFTVCEILRRQASTARIPVFMLTALTSEFSRLHGLEVGADEFLSKPFSPRDLVEQMQRVLQDRRLDLEMENLEAGFDEESNMWEYR